MKSSLLKRKFLSTVVTHTILFFKRITEDGDTRITEDGMNRILE